MKALRLSLIAVPVIAAIALAGSAFGGGGGATIEQSQAAGWDCNPQVPIIGYLHCAPPGKPSVADMIGGDRSSPSIVLRVFYLNGDFAGTEMLLRNDLYQAQACPQDGLAEWGALPFGYRACHHFDT